MFLTPEIYEKADRQTDVKIIRLESRSPGRCQQPEQMYSRVAPHTHNMEYILGNFAYWSLQKPLKIIIKDAHTKAWYGGIVKGLGGIGIDRSQKNDLVNFVAHQFAKEDFSLVITPEGTRSWVPKWIKGFYHMALAAKVPIVLAAGDFKRKIVYLGYTIPYERIASVPFAEIMQEIQDYYIKNDIVPKVPANWNPNITGTGE